MKLPYLLTPLFLLSVLNSPTLFCQPNDEVHSEHEIIIQINELLAPSSPVQDCPICLSALDNPEEITTLLCPATKFENRHRFHTFCITQALEFKKECPTCREKNPTILTDETVAARVKQLFDKSPEAKTKKYLLTLAPLALISACSAYLALSYFISPEEAVDIIPFDRLAACKDGLLSYCTHEELCTLHDLWEACPCSLDDLRGCWSIICSKVPFCS